MSNHVRRGRREKERRQRVALANLMARVKYGASKAQAQELAALEVALVRPNYGS